MTLIKCKENKFLSYVFFAIITTVINVGVYLLCYNFIYPSIILSNIAAYTVSIIASFLINKKIVFKNEGKRVFLQFLAYLVVKIVSFSIDSFILYILKDVFGVSNFLSKIISNASTTISNYTLNNLWVFKKDK